MYRSVTTQCNFSRRRRPSKHCTLLREFRRLSRSYLSLDYCLIVNTLSIKLVESAGDEAQPWQLSARDDSDIDSFITKFANLSLEPFPLDPPSAVVSPSKFSPPPSSSLSTGFCDIEHFSCPSSDDNSRLIANLPLDELCSKCADENLLTMSVEVCETIYYDETWSNVYQCPSRSWIDQSSDPLPLGPHHIFSPLIVVDFNLEFYSCELNYSSFLDDDEFDFDLLSLDQLIPVPPPDFTFPDLMVDGSIRALTRSFPSGYLTCQKHGSHSVPDLASYVVGCKYFPTLDFRPRAVMPCVTVFIPFGFCAGFDGIERDESYFRRSCTGVKITHDPRVAFLSALSIWIFPARFRFPSTLYLAMCSSHSLIAFVDNVRELLTHHHCLSGWLDYLSRL